MPPRSHTRAMPCRHYADMIRHCYMLPCRRYASALLAIFAAADDTPRCSPYFRRLLPPFSMLTLIISRCWRDAKMLLQSLCYQPRICAADYAAAAALIRLMPLRRVDFADTSSLYTLPPMPRFAFDVSPQNNTPAYSTGRHRQYRTR